MIICRAVKDNNERVVISILRMNISALADPHPSYPTSVQLSKPMCIQDLTSAQFLLGITEKCKEETLVHVATNVGNVTILEALIRCSGLPINAIINKRYSKIYQCIEQTPLSLALAHTSCRELIDLFIKLQSAGHYVTHIDLSNTLTLCIPKELFNFLSTIKLDVSSNMLKDMPFSQLPSQLRLGQLTDLDLSSNELNSVPVDIFGLPNLKFLNISRNPIKFLPKLWWLSSSLVKFNASETHLTELFAYENHSQHLLSRRLTRLSFDGNSFDYDSSEVEGCQLRKLDVSKCNLHTFPPYLACYFPNLTHLNISHNNITSCCALNELPASLDELNISYNKLQSHDQPIFHLSTNKDNLYCPRNNDLDCSLKCSHMRHNQLVNLGTLNLSDNKDLQEIVTSYDDLTASSGTSCLFFPKLKKFMIKNCGLSQAPAHLNKMSRIHHLDVSGNNMKVPREICSLKDLCTFIYDGLPDPVVADLSKFTSIKDQQMFLLQEK